MSATLAVLLPLAQQRLGPRASVRLALAQGTRTADPTYVATAFRSTTHGPGAEEAMCETGATEGAALDALHERLFDPHSERWVRP